jgi:hypothetical protein
MTVKFNSVTKIVQSGSNLVFTDQNNPQGWTLAQLATSGTSGGSIVSGAFVGGNAWVDGGAAPGGGTQIRTTSSVAISDSTENFFAGMKGTDIFFYVSGTTGSPGASSPFKAAFGGDVVMSGTLTLKGLAGGALIVSGAGGITGSLTQTGVAGLPFIVGIGGTFITTNSLGQIIISSSLTAGGGGTTPGVNVQNQGATLPASPYTILNFVGAGVSTADVGGVATVTIPGGQPGLVPGAFAVYSGYTTASLWWNQTGSFAGFTGSLNGGTFVDRTNVNILRNGSTFTFLQTGFYRFLADFNAYGSDAYITLQLSGTSGDVLERTTYRSTPTDQNLMILDGILQINSGNTYTLQYVTQGTTYAWTGSNPLPDGDNMRTGEINIFLIPSGTATVNNYSITASGGGGTAPANYAMGTGSNPFNGYVFSSTTPGFQNVPNLSATITTTGSPVMIMANANWVAYSAGAQAIFSLSRDGINMGTPYWGLMAAGPTANGYNNNASYVFVDFPVAGTHTYNYTVSASIGVGAISGLGVGPGALMAFEMKNSNVVTSSTSLAQAVPGGAVIGLSASIVPTKGPILAIVSTNMSSDTNGAWSWSDLYRNGNSLAGGSSNGMTVVVGSAVNEIQGSCIMVLDTGATMNSTNTYAYRATNGAGANHINLNGQLSSIILWELPDVNWKTNQSTDSTTFVVSPPSYYDFAKTTPVQSLVTRGRPVLLMTNAQFNTVGGAGRASATFLRNGSSISNTSKGFQLLDGEGNSDWNKSAFMAWLDVVPAGFYTYQVAGANVSGSSQPAQGSYTNFFAYELDAAGGSGINIGGWYDEGNFLFTTASIQAIGNAQFGGSLTVGGNETLGGTLQVQGAGTSYVSGNLTILGTLTFASGSGMAITGSAVSRTFNVPLLMGMVTSPQYSGSKVGLGTNYFNPTKFNKGIDSIRYFFRSTFAPVFGNGSAFVDLYDYSGIVTGTPGPISGTVLTSSTPSSLTMQQIEITSLMNTVTGSGIIMARAWCDPSGSNFVNVGSTELVVEWL